MKHVFVETNFLIEVARPCPDEAALRLLNRHHVDLLLYVPWCSLTEARRTLERVVDDDLNFEKAMLKFARHERLADHDRDAMGTLQKFAARAREVRRVAKAGIDSNVDQLAHRLEVIPPSPDIVAETLRIWTAKRLPPFDEMVLGAVVAAAFALYQRGERKLFFCNLNKSDFSPADRSNATISRPDLEAEYRRCGLTYLPSFDVPR